MLIINEGFKKFQNAYTPALNKINLELKEGEFCILIGSNGSGKSTLLKAINGECSLDSGQIEIQNQLITHHKIHQRAQFISSLSQDVTQATISEMTVLENMTLSYGENIKNKNSKIKNELKSINLGLENHLHTPLKNLSGGQRQMIATLMAFSKNPKILLLDEHTSALDPHSQKILMQFTVDNIKKTKVSTIMITHHMQDALDFGERLIMLNQGRIILDLKGKAKNEITLSRLYDLFHEGAKQ